MSSREERKKKKEELENKIVELEGKLSKLSSMLGKDELNPMVGGFNEREHSPLDPRIRRNIMDDVIRGNRYGRGLLGGTLRITEADIKDPTDLDPDGSAKRQLLAIAEENYKKDLERRRSNRGSMPKGFGVDPHDIYQMILSYDKKYARFLFKKGKCLGCKKQVDNQHKILCHECANDKLNETEFRHVINLFTRWGLYKKPFLTKIALKLKLAKVVTEEKNK